MKVITETAKDKIRILQVVGLMDMGGLETWLVNVLRNINRQKFQIDFLVETTKTCAYDKEVLALGSKIIPCLHPSQPLLYGRNFKRLYRQHGPYDIIHSHIHNYSGYILRLAKEVGIPIRISHSHNDTSSLKVKTGLYRNLYLMLTEHWIKQYATVGLACSSRAADSLYGRNWRNDPRFFIHHCGIDLSKWNLETDAATIRREMGIAEDAFVLGHVGRFAEQKNHSFLIDILTEVVKRKPKTQLLLVGDGHLLPDIEKKVYEADLTEHVVFAGLRSNVHQIMQGAMDAFVFPSLYEGLPLVLMEAQASGLPCIFSDVISEEANIIQPLVNTISLAQPASYWAEVILDVANTKSKILSTESLSIAKESSFNIEKSVQGLESLYCSSVDKLKVRR
ncbi:MAG: glycosyltransferase family 1 protein [Scytonematopsis contorta HA4267-MV1]|jgi:glycosyltransferase involved in cell wall biosynthesis|nr:glycosyltransferase family 1 protein [Scytonematopsis contorta HA4267-MV1]